MTKWIPDILGAVGQTPLVRLGRLSPPHGGAIFAKFEAVNPGGSIKTRTALGMIEAAEAEGLLNSASVIIEVTSGNQGIAMAMIGAVKGYKVIIIMPENMSGERRSLIQAYGAEIILTPAGNSIREAMENGLAKAEAMTAENPAIFWPRQFENRANPQAHRRTTGREIVAQMDGAVDAFVAGFGTGGTITGVGEALREAFPAVRIIAAEPDRAAILSGGEIGHHAQQGIGDGIIPPILNRELVDGVIRISDEEAIAAARRLAREEGLLCGVSGGTNAAAAIKVARELGPGKSIVTVLPDTGERYLSMGLF